MATSQFQIDGETAIVTGGSRGIGREIAERVIQEEVNVALCSRDLSRVEPVADELGETYSAEALAVECDVRDREAVDRMVDETLHEFGSLDLLVNNAGASFMAPFEEISPNGWDSIVSINLEGTYNFCQAAGEKMMDSDGGIIINMSSVAGQLGAPFMSHYASAKSGIINLTRSLAQEWSSKGIRVNCVAPGYVATEGVQEQMGIEAGDVDRSDVDRNMGLTEEIADIVQFLASPASSYIVGQTITCQGVPPSLELPEEGN
ncbi:MAG: SDR family NAD(P)-dependent oxidoreductase [bacterium]